MAPTGTVHRDSGPGSRRGTITLTLGTSPLFLLTSMTSLFSLKAFKLLCALVLMDAWHSLNHPNHPNQAPASSNSHPGCLLGFLSCADAVFVRPKTPDYNELDKWDPSPLSTDPQFVKTCQEYAGYYKDPTRDPAQALRKTIVMAGVNNGYKDFFHNFKCYMDRLGIKFFPVSLDEGIYGYLTGNKIANTYLMGDIPGRTKVAAEPSRFGGQNFNLIGCRKIEAVAGALKLGYDVIFSDVDIAVLHDPLKHVFLPGIDYAHSSNNGCNKKWRFNETMEGNTGFYAVKSNPQTIRTFDLTYRLCARNPLYDDQTMFWLILRTNENPRPKPVANCPLVNTNSNANIHANTNANSSVIVSCMLETCMFSSGNLREPRYYDDLFSSLRQSKRRAVAVHANWMSGKDNKKAAMAQSGLWIARRVANINNNEAAKKQKLNKNKGRPTTGNWTCVEPQGKLTTLG